MAPVVYLVEKTFWQYNDCWYDLVDTVPQKAFLSVDAAQRHCAILEKQAHRGVEAGDLLPYGACEDNDVVYKLGGYNRVTRLSTEEFAERIAAFGIVLTPSHDSFLFVEWNRYAEDSWWETTWLTLSSEQKDGFWSLCNEVRFYEVVAVEVGE